MQNQSNMNREVECEHPSSFKSTPHSQ